MQQTPYVDFIGRHLPLPLPGHDLRRARGVPARRPTSARRSTTTCRRTTATSTTGFYNGESYNEAGSQRPEGLHDPRHACVRCPRRSVLRGLRFTGFYDQRRCTSRTPTARAASSRTTFEHTYVNAAFEYHGHQGSDVGRARASRTAEGWSVWVTPKTTTGWEGLLRFDHLEPDDNDQTRSASARSPASPTGSRTRATSRRRCCSTTTTRRSTASRRRSRRSADRGARAGEFLDGDDHDEQDTGGDRHEAILGVRRCARGRDARARRTVQINGAGATFPAPIYTKWFSEYNKLHPERPDQLPAARLGRRHPAGDRADRVLRRHRRADDHEQLHGGARQDPALPDRARRGGAGLQHPRRAHRS